MATLSKVTFIILSGQYLIPADSPSEHAAKVPPGGVSRSLGNTPGGGEGEGEGEGVRLSRE